MLKGVDDIRVQTMCYLLSVDDANVTRDQDFVRACDDYTSGRYQSAATCLGAVADDCWRFELTARTRSALQDKTIANGFSAQIINDFQAFLDLSKDLVVTQSSLEKHLLLTRKLPASRVVSAMLDRQLELTLDRPFTTNELLWCLNSPLLQPQNFAMLRKIDSSVYGRLIRDTDSGNSITVAMYRLCVGGNIKDLAELNRLAIPDHRRFLYSSYAAYNCADLKMAASIYEKYRHEIGPAQSPRAISFQYAILRRLNSIDQALEAFTDAYLSNKRLYAPATRGGFERTILSRWTI
ncbi:hypothetical protein [Methylocella sp.]|uniref:hypothetical protein n=1 Tax=Methylocella sp. TaxID=1978226 RepID=UPI003C23A5B9